MRYSIFLFICLLSVNGWSQTGSILVNCIDETTQEPIVVCIDVKSDSLLLNSGFTDLSGAIKFSSLPLGLVKLQFSRNGESIGQKIAFVQENQVFHLTIQVGDNGSSTNPSGESFQLSSEGQLNELGDLSLSDRYIDGNFPVRTISSNNITRMPVKQLSCVQVVAYRRRLIDVSDSRIGYIYNKEDINAISFRSPMEFASMVAGARLNEESRELNIRGARSDANTYFLDGMRVRNLDNIPKAHMGQITIMTGGIPANYGDVTGGVIAVDSRAIKYYRVPRFRTYAPPVQTYQLPVEIIEPPIQASIPRPEVKEIGINSFNMDRFAPIYENDFSSTIGNPNSTFSIDVDRASWTYVQNQFAHGKSIARDAVKLEEMINAFSYKKVIVPETELMQVELERSECAWNKESQLVTIHLKSKDLAIDSVRKAHNFVFLIDVSGSMDSENKIKLLKNGLIDFVKTLNRTDLVSIVTYSGYVKVALVPTHCNETDKIIRAISALYAEGSTNGEGGIQKAYEMAEKNYNPALNNRIIMCTDGDFNVGINNTNELEEYISTKRGTGIYLTALGFGMGNYRNDILETLADRGDGNHFYINSLTACNKVLVDEIGNLITVARDVKLNVEFNPKFVSEYRLIGYENRLLKPRDFDDDTKDAGEIGYGHEVTAVYEIRLGKAEKEKTSFTKSKESGANNSDLAIVKLRYKSFEEKTSVKREFKLSVKDSIVKNDLLNTVVSFGLLMRNSAFKGEMTKAGLVELTKTLGSNSGDVMELKKMIEGYAML